MRKIFLLIIPIITFFFLINLSTRPTSASQFDLGDKTSNGNDLTNHGATEWTADTPFAGSTEAVKTTAASGEYLSAEDASSLDLATTGTLELWINPASLPTSGHGYTLISKDDEQAQRSYQLRLENSGGTLRFEAVVLGNSTDDFYYWNYTPSTNAWAHVALTMDTTQASNATFELFINGSSQGHGTLVFRCEQWRHGGGSSVRYPIREAFVCK